MNCLRHFRIVFLGLCLLPGLLTAQVAYWQQYLGGSRYDLGKRMIYRPDGTLILAGETFSRDKIGKENHSDDYDVVVYKYATQGTFFWLRTLGGSGWEELADLIETRDGGFALIGTSNSSDGDIPQNRGGTDIWVAKLDDRGRLEWSQTFGGRGDDRGAAIVEIDNGYFFIGGESASNNGSMRSPHHGGLDAWLAKLNPEGNLIWERHYGGSGNEKLRSLHLKSADSLLLISSSDSKNLEMSNNLGKKDLWICGLDGQGEMRWQANYGGEDNDDVHRSVVDTAGNIWLVGTTFSSQFYIQQQRGLGDCWLLKLDPDGNFLWSQTYGGERADGANAVTPTADGGALIAGLTRSRGGDIEFNQGYYDGWLAKVDAQGNRLWSRTLGYAQKDVFNDIRALPSGGLLTFGYSVISPHDPAHVSHNGGADMWLCNFGDPEKGIAVRPFRTPPVLMGRVKDKETGRPLQAVLTLTDNKTLDSLSSTVSDPEDGSFVLLMPAYGLVSINVLTAGYLFYGQDILMDTVIDRTLVEKKIELEAIRIGSSLILKNIYFETGKWTLLPNSYAELERVVDFMKLNPRVQIQVSGHTDNTGNRSQKVELSQRRAREVKAYLVKKGIRDMRMKVKGYGMYRPIANNRTAEGRRKNRRVEFEVIYK